MAYENLILKILIPIIATVISIISLYISTRNTKRGIRVNKLEEILDIIFYMQMYYRPTFILVSDITRFRDELSKGTLHTNLMDNIRINIERHKTRFDDAKVMEKLTRLSVISNAYLSNKNELKMQIQFLIELIIDMNRVVECEGNFIPEHIKKGLPRSGDTAKLFRLIDESIIKEMGLGFKNINWDDYRIYRNNYRNKLTNSN